MVLQRQYERGSIAPWLFEIFQMLFARTSVSEQLCMMGISDLWFIECWGERAADAKLWSPAKLRCQRGRILESIQRACVLQLTQRPDLLGLLIRALCIRLEHDGLIDKSMHDSWRPEAERVGAELSRGGCTAEGVAGLVFASSSLRLHQFRDRVGTIVGAMAAEDCERTPLGIPDESSECGSAKLQPNEPQESLCDEELSSSNTPRMALLSRADSDYLD